MTYREYSEVYGAIVPVIEDEFEYFDKKARALLEEYTFGRSLDSEDENVRMAEAELVGWLYDNRGRGGVVSESNDGYSISYSAEKYGAREIIKQWLGASGMMYGGVVSDDN